jgi:Tol biopolymer transport system component
MTLLGKYELHEIIGEGSFGVVYRATDSIGRVVALKVLKANWAGDAETRQRFRREALAAGSLYHPHIATIHDFDEVDGRVFLAMRYVDGPSLKTVLQERGRLQWTETARILQEVGSALDYAHAQGMIHRDIKPANILLSPKEGAVLTDFGLVYAASQGSISASGQILGTPNYIAPEVWLGQPVSAATDVYSLGCVVCEMLTGQVLFPGSSPFEVVGRHYEGPRFPEQWPDDAPRGLRAALEKALAKEPGQRYASAGEMVEGLARREKQAERPTQTVKTEPVLPLAEHEPVQPGPAGPRPGGWKKMALLAGGGIVALVAFILFISSLSDGKQAAAQKAAATPTAGVVAAVEASPTPLPTKTATPVPTATATLVPTATQVGGGAGRIAFTSNRNGTYQIYAMNTDGSDLARISKSNATDWDFTWSPDGKQIAFATNRDGIYEIYAMNADGSNPVNLTRNSGDDDSPAWSPDGKKIAFRSRRDKNYDIYVMNADGSSQVRLTTSLAGDGSPKWSPDGKQIVFTPDRHIMVMNADGTNPYYLTKNTEDDMPDWSPDGKHIVFMSNRDSNWEIYVMNADGTQPVRLTNNQNADVNPVWSPDGKMISFASDRDGNSEIYAMNADGSNPTRLTNDAEDDRFIAWQPGPTRPMVSEPGPAATPRSDTGTLAFEMLREGDAEVYSLNVDGSHPRYLTQNPGTDWVGDWSPDGEKIAIASQQGGNWEIMVMNADGSDPVNISNNLNMDMDPVWSPDGKQIAFASNRSGNYDIFVVNADGSSQMQITNNAAEDMNPAWSPDGKRIAYQSGQKGSDFLNIFAIDADGSHLVLLTPGDTKNYEPVWSPDGRQIAFVSNRGGSDDIYLVNADGTNLVSLTNDHQIHIDNVDPAWSPDGKRIAFTSTVNYEGAICVIDADGTNLVRLTSDPVYGQYPVWSPDGQWIAFSNQTQDGFDRVYAMRLADHGLFLLTDKAAPDTRPIWQPGVR